MSKTETPPLDRRDFFRKVGMGAGAAAVSVSASAVQAAVPEAQTPSDAAGYRESEHVKRYYELARF
jgi:hypothetical protein